LTHFFNLLDIAFFVKEVFLLDIAFFVKEVFLLDIASFIRRFYLLISRKHNIHFVQFVHIYFSPLIYIYQLYIMDKKITMFYNTNRSYFPNT